MYIIHYNMVGTLKYFSLCPGIKMRLPVVLFVCVCLLVWGLCDLCIFLSVVLCFFVLIPLNIRCLLCWRFNKTRFTFFCDNSDSESDGSMSCAAASCHGDPLLIMFIRCENWIHFLLPIFRNNNDDMVNWGHSEKEDELIDMWLRISNRQKTRMAPISEHTSCDMPHILWVWFGYWLLNTTY